VDEADAPITGASVVLDGSATVTTDASGKFEFTNLTEGQFTLAISAAGYASITASGSMVAGVNDIGKLTLSVQPATSTLSGIVTDADTQFAEMAGAIWAGGPIHDPPLAQDGTQQLATGSIAARLLLRRQQLDQHADGIALLWRQRQKILEYRPLAWRNPVRPHELRRAHLILATVAQRLRVETQQLRQHHQLVLLRQAFAVQPTPHRLKANRRTAVA
jgi:hypothetical protein